MKKSFLAVFCLFIPLFLFSQSEKNAEEEINDQTSKFKIILQTAVKNYKDTFNIKKISEVALNAMLKELDNFSSYFSAEDYKSINDVYKGSSHSTGLSIISLNDTLTVTAVAKPSPASEAGIFAGDKILFINGTNAIKMNGTEANTKLNQNPDTSVTIIVKRGYSGDLKEYNLTKREVTISTITASHIIRGSDIGYIKFVKFSSIADKEFRENLSLLKKQGMKSLILDLRGNTGGYMEQVVKMTDDIMSGSDTITYTKARAKDFLYTHTATSGSEFETLPLIILIDANSASASEILAGAVQDLDRGLVVGTISYGKGSVQKFWEFKDGSAFRLTVAGYYTPSGRSIQKSSTKEQFELPAQAKLNMDDKSQKLMQEMIQKTGGKMNVPVYQTSKGRTVLGGGGIFPDYFVDDDSTTKLFQIFKTNGLFLDFSHRYMYSHRSEIVKKYDDDYSKCDKDMSSDTNLISQFIDYAKSKKVWNDKMYQSDKAIIDAYVRAFILYSLWGDPAYYMALSSIDKQIKKSVEIMPEARKFIIN